MYRYLNRGVLNNFHNHGNNISYFSGFVRIGDFKLEKETNYKIIDDAKVGLAIYGIKDMEELKNTNKKIIVVIPALTGTAKIFSTSFSQGDGWANMYGKPGNILDPNNSIVIGLDYFGGPYDSSGPDKHDLNFYPVPASKQIEAWKKALLKIGIKKIDIVLGGSNGGGHVHHWAFDDILCPRKIVSIAGPIAPTEDAKEFFRLQIAFLKYKEDVSFRLEQNLKQFFGVSKIYDFLVEHTQYEIQECIENYNYKKALKIARQIGFLRFLNPLFFDKFYKSKEGKLLNFEEAKKNVLSYFDYQGEKFEERFSIPTLILLSEAIAYAYRLKPEKYVEKINKKVDITVLAIDDDNLFKAEPFVNYFEKVKKLRKQENHTGSVKILHLTSNDNTKKAGHDSFLWPEEIDRISVLLKKLI